MGIIADGGGRGRAGRRLGPLVAAVAGATVVAALAGAHRRRRRNIRISPQDAVAGPAIDEVDVPTADAGPVTTAEPPIGAATPADTAPADTAPADTAPADTAPADTAPADTAPADDPLFAGEPGANEPPAVGEPVIRSPAVLSPVPARPEHAHDVAVPLARRGRLIAGIAVAVALVVGASALVAASAGDDGQTSAAAVSTDDTTEPRPSTTTTLPPVTPAEAFGLAGQRITGAGSFSYTGTVSATDVSHVRPMFWLAVESTVDGQVATSTGRLHEIAVAADGRAAETVTDGPTVWGRRAAAVDDLVDEPYEAIPALSGDAAPAKGAALLPAWLVSATDPSGAGVDALGRRTFRATIPADVLGEIERDRRPVDATVVLTLDDAGDPVRVDITSAPDGPVLHLLFEISGIGAPVTIAPPA
jgi:hypothetical protein